MSNKITHFTDLYAWQKNRKLVFEIYKLIKNFRKMNYLG